MMVEANRIPPIHQRRFAIGLRIAVVLGLGVGMTGSAIIIHLTTIRSHPPPLASQKSWPSLQRFYAR